MHPEIFSDVTGVRRSPKPAVLSGYRRGRLRGRTYPAIRQRPGDEVNGHFFPDVPAQGWQRLDRFEGVLYRREIVSVFLPETATWSSAGVYVLEEPYAGEFLDVPWSYEDFLVKDLEHFRREYFGFGAVSSKDASPGSPMP